MARIRIDLPENVLFTAEIPVRVSDLNYGGHVGNDAVLGLMQEARVLFYRSMGFKDELSFEGSVGQIIADAAVEYRAESFIGDILIIGIGVADVSRVGFDMVYKLTNRDTGQEVARGKTGIVCFDYERRKVSAIPAVLKEKILKHYG